MGNIWLLFLLNIRSASTPTIGKIYKYHVITKVTIRSWFFPFVAGRNSTYVADLISSRLKIIKYYNLTYHVNHMAISTQLL